MRAKKITDMTGMSIYTDFPLGSDQGVAANFLNTLETVAGVESINAYKYHIEIQVGVLFDLSPVIRDVVSVFEDFYAVVVTDLTEEDLSGRIQHGLNKAPGDAGLGLFGHDEIPEA